MYVARLERRQIEKSSDSVHIEQVCFARMARETDRDDRQVGDGGIIFPIRQRHGGEQLVIANDDIGTVHRDELERLGQSDAGHAIETKILEEATEMFAEKRVTSDTQRSHAENIPPGRPEVQRPGGTNGT